MLIWASSKRKKWVSPCIPKQGILRTYCFLEDGHREVHFLYSLTKGITQNSFGVECARLAGLPDSTLQVAVQRSAHSAEMERLRLRTRRYGESSRFRLVAYMRSSTILGYAMLFERPESFWQRRTVPVKDQDN